MVLVYISDVDYMSDGTDYVLYMAAEIDVDIDDILSTCAYSDAVDDIDVHNADVSFALMLTVMLVHNVQIKEPVLVLMSIDDFHYFGFRY